MLDSYAQIELATPAERPADIPRLLDALIVEEHARPGGGDLRPLAALGAANLEGLTTSGSAPRPARARWASGPQRRWCRPSLASASA